MGAGGGVSWSLQPCCPPPALVTLVSVSSTAALVQYWSETSPPVTHWRHTRNLSSSHHTLCWNSLWMDDLGNIGRVWLFQRIRNLVRYFTTRNILETIEWRVCWSTIFFKNLKKTFWLNNFFQVIGIVLKLYIWIYYLLLFFQYYLLFLKHKTRKKHHLMHHMQCHLHFKFKVQNLARTLNHSDYNEGRSSFCLPNNIGAADRARAVPAGDNPAYVYIITTCPPRRGNLSLGSSLSGLRTTVSYFNLWSSIYCFH